MNYNACPECANFICNGCCETYERQAEIENVIEDITGAKEFLPETTWKQENFADFKCEFCHQRCIELTKYVFQTFKKEVKK